MWLGKVLVRHGVKRAWSRRAPPRIYPCDVEREKFCPIGVAGDMQAIFPRSYSGTASEPEKKSGTTRESIWTVPNILTLSRIAATPYVSWLVIDGQYRSAMLGLGVLGFTDWLDGYLARKLNQQTVFGSLIDPVADKVLITSFCLAEAHCGLLPAGLVALIVGRDVSLVAGGFWLRAKTKPADVKFFDTTHEGVLKASPSLLSKANTCGQTGLLTFALTNAVYAVPSTMYLDALIWGVGGSTLASGIDYMWNTKKYIPKAPDGERK